MTAVGGICGRGYVCAGTKAKSYWLGQSFAESVGGIKSVLDRRRICMAVGDYNEIKSGSASCYRSHSVVSVRVRLCFTAAVLELSLGVWCSVDQWISGGGGGD